MTRAGREPAEDVKRRIVAAFEEVGLSKVHAHAKLIPGTNSRGILVYMAVGPPGSEDESDIEVSALIDTNGNWSEEVRIACSAGRNDDLHRPVMQGRDRVPLSDLITQLQETLKEREQVLSAMQAGVKPPFHFASTVWKIPKLAL